MSYIYPIYVLCPDAKKYCSRHPRSYKSISFYIPIHRPFLTLKNNKQFLNQMQIKTIINSTNETSRHFCFRLHSHTIQYPNKQLLFKVNNRRQNNMQKTVTDVSMVSLLPILNFTPYPASAPPLLTLNMQLVARQKTCSY